MYDVEGSPVDWGLKLRWSCFRLSSRRYISEMAQDRKKIELKGYN